MSTTSASSLFFPSLNPKTLASLSNSVKPTLVSFSSSSPKPIPTLFHSSSPVHSRFVRNVAVSAEVGQDEDVLSSADDEPSFSPDLKLFVGNLPFSVDSAQLAGVFESAGNVEMVEVIYDKVTGRSRGFGFVTMSTPEEAEAAAQQFNGYELEGRPLRVNSGPPPQRDNSFPIGPRGGGGGGFDSANRLYVGNLSWGVDDMALKALFRDKWNVVEARVVYDRDTGRSRGFGFVSFNSAEDMNDAMDSLDGYVSFSFSALDDVVRNYAHELDGRTIRVSVAESRPRRQF
ncbi:hypothetical protein Tsubulata_000156 [Turnera subulata]|uniref:RRM domain-containing protein n=1 Tax=Turnera subulata TaxID=218843 RepID=A0A9Q0GD48_9ROSI|nr:hypothetical protein Tsubulata_000156 [Turnera subulata]